VSAASMPPCTVDNISHKAYHLTALTSLGEALQEVRPRVELDRASQKSFHAASRQLPLQDTLIALAQSRTPMASTQYPHARCRLRSSDCSWRSDAFSSGAVLRHDIGCCEYRTRHSRHVRLTGSPSLCDGNRRSSRTLRRFHPCDDPFQTSNAGCSRLFNRNQTSSRRLTAARST